MIRVSFRGVTGVRVQGLTCSSSMSGEGLGLNSAAHSSSKAKGLSRICQENALRMLYAARASPAKPSAVVSNSNSSLGSSGSSSSSSSQSSSSTAAAAASAAEQQSSRAAAAAVAAASAAAAAAATYHKHGKRRICMSETDQLHVRVGANQQH